MAKNIFEDEQKGIVVSHDNRTHTMIVKVGGTEVEKRSGVISVKYSYLSDFGRKLNIGLRGVSGKIESLAIQV